MGGVVKNVMKVFRKGKLDVSGIAITAGLSLVQSEEMVESLRGNDHVLAGVET